jgi:hypothetical protein
LNRIYIYIYIYKEKKEKEKKRKKKKKKKKREEDGLSQTSNMYNWHLLKCVTLTNHGLSHPDTSNSWKE